MLHFSRKTISVPGAIPFNGAVAATPAGRFLFYRFDEYRIGHVLVDENFRAIRCTHRIMGMACNEDPRIVWLRDRMYLSTHWSIEGRIELRELELTNRAEFRIRKEMKFDHIFNDNTYRKRCREKNWTPWVWNDQLLYTHTMNPHRILKINMATKTVSLKCVSFWSAPWWTAGWGLQFRLNTPPVRLSDGCYLSTFHCPGIGGYYSGFYLFEGKLPFRILRVSREPALTPLNTTAWNPRTGVKCIFLLGLLVNERHDSVIVTGGDNDHSVVAFHFSLNEIMASLIPVSPSPAARSANPLSSDTPVRDVRFDSRLRSSERFRNGLRHEQVR